MIGTVELRQKKAYNEETNFHDEIEEKRWSEGWAVLMADGYGYGEKRVAWEEMRKRKKTKRRKKRDGLKDETGHSKWGPPCQYIYRNAIENRVKEIENS